MISGAFIFVAATYLVMLVAARLSHWRVFHATVMGTIVVIDMLIPVYLVFTRDWYFRLITQEEIFSFMIWMHVILVLALYALYILQIPAGRRLLRGDDSVRPDHRSQGIGILIVRGLVVLSAVMLIEPATPPPV
jgi:hypothetical protein